jgi:hypothetical protein
MLVQYHQGQCYFGDTKTHSNGFEFRNVRLRTDLPRGSVHSDVADNSGTSAQLPPECEIEPLRWHFELKSKFLVT